MNDRTVRSLLAGWLIDGSGSPPRKRMVITVCGDDIVAISPYRPDAPGATPSVYEDLTHCVVVPPLIDSHVHLCMSGSIDPTVRQAVEMMDCKALKALIDEQLRQLAVHGVMAVRDGGDRQQCLLGYCPEYGHGRGRVVVRRSGHAYYRKGRYGRLIGGRPVDGESLLSVYERDNQNIDQVKVVNSGVNSLVEFGRQTAPQFSVEELRALVDRAHEQGRTVMVHANGEEPVKHAVKAGCDSIEHGYFIGRETIELMAEKGTFWVPTLFTMKAFADYADSYRGQADRRVIERTLNSQLQQLSYARECGVRVAVGTDAGSAGVLHGESVAEEMKLFMKAGYSLAGAVQCATTHGAQLLQLGHRWGRLEPGKRADFLTVRGTPAQLPRKLMYLEAIYEGGRPARWFKR